MTEKLAEKRGGEKRRGDQRSGAQRGGEKHLTEKRSRGKKIEWRRIGILLCLGLACLCLAGCGTDDIDISAYQDETLTLQGITDRDISLTIGDLKALDCVTVKAESTSDKIGQVRATGPTLETVLREFGSSLSDVKKIHVYARDDYDAKIDLSLLEGEDVILAFGIDGQPLGAEDAPLRIIIPGSDSAWWVRMVERIEIE